MVETFKYNLRDNSKVKRELIFSSGKRQDRVISIDFIQCTLTIIIISRFSILFGLIYGVVRTATCLLILEMSLTEWRHTLCSPQCH